MTPVPQPGIFALGTRSHHHLELDLVPGASSTDVLAAVAALRETFTSVVGVNVVVGFGPAAWRVVAPDQVPTDFEDFTPVEGVEGFAYPATQHDLWLWFHGAGSDAMFDAARGVAAALAGLAVVRAEQPCFSYQRSQDLSGFEDGTENPPLDEAPTIATVAAGEPGAGGSIVLVQRWVHDLDGLEALPVPEREQVIGRTLAASEELPDDVRPASSHISRVVIEDDDGEELEVFRRSVAFGGVLEHGLQFVAFSADRARLQRMLDRMAGLEDGVRDALTRFSTPTSGAWYFAPPVDLLR